MPNTETRWRLKRDWPSPFRETIPAGTISVRDGDPPRWYLGLPNQYPYLETVRDPSEWPDWFERLTWCLDCDREVCPKSTQGCSDKAHEMDYLCHGHAAPRPDTSGVQRMSLSSITEGSFLFAIAL